MTRSNETSTSARSMNLQHAIAMILAMSATMGSLVTFQSHAQEASADTPTTEKKAKKEEGDVANLSDVNVSADTLRAFSTEPSASSMGFAKPLQETPRAVSFVSEEQLSKFGIQSVQDLTRLVPGTYTTTRYGLQGAINVRTVTADQYYRGMKRLDQQGHVRTVLSAYDNIEVVKGPPSPVYGMGRIGGYTVLDPKSSRARTGKYMTDDQGYFQALTGSYKLSEIQFGEGVPFTIMGHNAGVYVVGLLENSEGWIKNVGAQQRFLQATSSVDRAVGPFRLEMGGQLQNSITSGSYMNRGTQALVDKGIYITGSPMVNLDVNGDGRIGYVETYLASPVTGAISGNNQALTQRYAWKTGTDGNPLPLASMRGTLNGVPQNFKDYLKAHTADISCPLAVYMRDTAPVAPTNGSTGSMLSRAIPVGYYLNPCNVGTTKVDYRRNGSYERQQNATQRMGYFDLIYDTDPSFTAKQQFFYDSIDSFKDSWLPYGERQYIKAWEDKVTLTKTLPTNWLPSWMSVNTLGSVNYRDTRGFIRSSGGDFDYRQDIMNQTCPGAGCEGSGTGGHYPNTMFWTQLINPSYATGAPITTYTNSQYSESGIGLMADITFFTHTNVVAGGRWDKVKAHVTTPVVQNPSTGTFSPDDTVVASYKAGLACTTQGQVVNKATGTTVCPGGFTPASDVTSDQSAKSWSISISHELPWGHMRPYFTAATSSLALDGSNNLFSNATVAGSPTIQGTGLVLGADGINHGSGGKIIGEASLREYGIKGELFGGKAQWTLDYFDQTRNDVSSPSDPSVAVEVTSTRTKGEEADFKYQITKKWYASISAVHMTSQYLTGGLNTNLEVSGRDLGFNDIDDGQGHVYPAEAFLYGGRTQLQLTDPNNIYADVPGLPNWQGALLTTYKLPFGFGVNAGAQYLSQSWANRIKTVKLPQVTLYDAGVTWDHKKTHLRFSAFNITDERYFQSGQTTNAELLTVMPGRRWQLQLKEEF